MSGVAEDSRDPGLEEVSGYCAIVDSVLLSVDHESLTPAGP